MTTASLAAVCIALLTLGYFLYGRFLERRVVQPDDSHPVPALAQRDGVDFEPARPAMLFGHHFTAIAGAGPIVGPLLATFLFGWGAGLVWILVGSVFIGGVHDYLALMCSSRKRGASIAQVSADVLSPRAAFSFSLFVWLAMLLIIAVFASLAAKTLVAVPQVVWPNLLLCPIALVIGLGVYKRGLGLLWATLLGLLLLTGSLFLGYYQPLSFQSVGDAAAQKTLWFFLVMLYCVAAAVLPVWLLLQPRDYLSSAFTFGGLLLAFIALFVASMPLGPENAPAFIGFSSSKGPLWPMLFILVACGACSGFHGLVASGTTVKQLPSERHGLSIGYGSMIMEGALAAQVTLLAAAGLYWVGDHSAAGVSLVLPEIAKAEGGDWPSVAFARGFANVVSIGLPFIGFPVALMFAGMALNATLLDTLDASTRLGRLILSETLGQKLPVLNNRWVSTLVTVGGATALGLSGGADTLWPVFGAANQLIAALILVVVSLYLLGARRPSVYSAIPAAFMLVTTIGALLYQAHGFAFADEPSFGLAALSLALAALGIYVTAEAAPKLFRMMLSGRGSLAEGPPAA